MREADALVFVSRQTVDTVMAKYPPQFGAKAHVVPHAFDRGLAPPAETSTRGNRLKLVYTGRFYGDVRTPDALLSAIARIAPERAVQLLLVGPDMTRYQSTVARYGIADAVTLSGAVPYVAALREAAAADVLVVVDAEAEGASMFLPSKLIDYLMLRKPLLGITPPSGASADLLHRLGFPTAPPNDVDAIEARLRELVTAWKQQQLDVPPQFDAVAAEYDIERTSARFADILDRWRECPA
jgi:glycosyltransferase involved in cell wall biosynthesis